MSSTNNNRSTSMSRPLARATLATTTDKAFHPTPPDHCESRQREGVEAYKTSTPSMGLLAELLVIGFNILTALFQSPRQAIAIINNAQFESEPTLATSGAHFAKLS